MQNDKPSLGLLHRLLRCSRTRKRNWGNEKKSTRLEKKERPKEVLHGYDYAATSPVLSILDSRIGSVNSMVLLQWQNSGE
jgi:hypothetical protein